MYFQKASPFCWRMMTSSQPVTSCVHAGAAVRISRAVSYHAR